VDEPPRSLLDALVVEDRPHLLVTLCADQARLGPFVVPGVTACLRCLDAHLGEDDPRRALVLEQLEDAGPMTAPYDPVLALAASALAVRDLTSYAEGDRPATWSTTITVGADLALPHRTWPRHPHCGCSWA
jgi:bacteriocin biosynthesis cyclodehydratase domain-containing protein